MKKKIAIGAGILTALLVAGGLWYTRPQSFWAVTGLDPGRISGVSGHATEGFSVEHGRARTTSWTMDHRGPGDEDYEALIALLERGSYRAKLSNLTAPFSDSEPGSERWVLLNFAVSKPLSVHIPVPQTMTIPIPDSHGYWQYNASDSQLQAEVLQYLKANGEQS